MLAVRVGERGRGGASVRRPLFRRTWRVGSRKAKRKSDKCCATRALARFESALGAVGAAELRLRYAGLPAVRRRLRLIALIEGPAVIRRMLGHLKLPTEVPAARPSRGPPTRSEPSAAKAEDDLAAP